MKKSRMRRSYRRPTKRSRSYVLRSDMNKKRNARRLAKFSIFFVLLCAVAFGVFKGWEKVRSFISASDYFKIKKIEFTGNKNILKGEILALLPFEAGDNILEVDLAKAEKDILKLKPELKNISIQRRIGKIAIKVKEREPVGFILIDGNKMGIDFENVPFPLRGEYLNKNFPEIDARNNYDREEILAFVKIFSEKAKEYFDKSVLFYYESVEDAAVELNDGIKIIWGKSDPGQFDLKLKRLKEVLADASNRYSAIEYVNLNYLESGRILVKPKTIASKQNLTNQLSAGKSVVKTAQ